MSIDSITNAGMQQMPMTMGTSSHGSQGSEVVDRQSNEVFVTIGDKEYKLGEYVASDREIEQSVKNINKELEVLQTNLQFRVHKETKQMMVKVINTDTNEVLREIPSEKTLDMLASMIEKAGLLLDKRV